MLRLVLRARARIGLFLVLAGLPACGNDAACTFDVDCPLEQRGSSSRCVPVQLAARPDASIPPGPDAGRDAEVTVPDSGPGLDAGPDAQVELACSLTIWLALQKGPSRPSEQGLAVGAG